MQSFLEACVPVCCLLVVIAYAVLRHWAVQGVFTVQRR